MDSAGRARRSRESVPVTVRREPRPGTVLVASGLMVDAVTMFAPGAVAFADGSILLAGSRSEVLRAAPASFVRREFPGAFLLPGLVNAHTHLQIPRWLDSHGEPIPIPASFVEWILRVIAWKRGAHPESFSRNFAEAAAEASSFGTTSVGEIAGPDLSVYAACPLRARVYAEGIGFSPEAAPEAVGSVTAAVLRLRKASLRNPLVASGVSPHGLYTVGEPLLRSLAELASRLKLPTCLHLLESSAEAEFLESGGGEIPGRLYAALHRDVSWYRGLGRPISEYLAETGLLREGLLLAHNVHLPTAQAEALRDGGARFVLCPRSNAAHGNGAPDITHFVDAGIPFALGTDSLASVPDLSLWEEIRYARSLYRGRKTEPELSRELFRAATENGAEALGLSTGILAPGAPADLAVVDDPGGDAGGALTNLVERTQRRNVRLTVIAGCVVHGDPA
jgi:cytosine/adenosine deaminase-related metal-dependent hydrolase